MQGCLAQFLPGTLPLLFGKMPLKGNSLLKVKGLEITEFVMYLETVQRLGSRINGRLAVPFCLLQKRKILEYLRLILSLAGLCFFMVCTPYLKSLFTEGLVLSTNPLSLGITRFPALPPSILSVLKKPEKKRMLQTGQSTESWPLFLIFFQRRLNGNG